MYERSSRVKPTQGLPCPDARAEFKSGLCHCQLSCRSTGLFAEKLRQILYKTDHHDNRGSCQSDEKQCGEDVHPKKRDGVHMSILG